MVMRVTVDIKLVMEPTFGIASERNKRISILHRSNLFHIINLINNRKKNYIYI
ncbi:hypothetical protein HanIR_Chr05g0227071 [Helianthus annuus]|nr:hypothetical protein HanIR_Chr05g0227071 [Helianthus annuus]